MNLPPFKEFPCLSSSTVFLREVRADDLNYLMDISFYNGVKATTLKEAAAMQEKINTDYRDGNSIHWGITDVTNGKIVGTCGYYRGFEEAAGELGCILLPQYRGMGYMTPAMQLAISFGKNEMKLKRIWAATTKKNDKALKLLDRLGFIFLMETANHEVEYDLAF